MWNGKLKAVTFSYDDGVQQDARLIALLNKYDLKSTFNINSGFFGQSGSLVRKGVEVRHDKWSPAEFPGVYAGHEVAVHTVTHPMLPDLPEEEILSQVEEDRKALEALVGYDVVGMAYPGGGLNHTPRVAQVIRNSTPIRYARTNEANHSFDLQENLYEFVPTVYHIMEPDWLFKLEREFLELQPDKPQLFYIWGHAYEFDIANTWALFEDFLRDISHREDIFYGTNRQVLLNLD